MGQRQEYWPVIGIDLGTTKSCVGIWHNGGVKIITNDQGNRTTPSWVAFTDKERLIGEAAVNQGRTNSTNTIFDAKRFIGRRFIDEMVQKDMKLWPFKVIADPDESNHKKPPMVEVTYKGEKKQLFAEEISAMVLMKMKDTAETYLKLPVKNAVITVPAYFNDSQRQATKDAAAIAGLHVIRIINEPTAAAIAYEFDKQKPDNDESKKNVLVFDLGGGTFDVSLASIEKNTFQVKAVRGDTGLGGCDFDSNMVSHFVNEFNTNHNIDVSQCPKALGRLRAACEKAKRTLSLITQTSIELDCLSHGIDFSSTISRSCFDDLNDVLFKKCIALVEQCLSDASIDKSDVDDIVLVGGSTRIPKVQELLLHLFDGKKELYKSINPDEAVAYGAAVYAWVLHGITTDKDMVLDVTPFSIGVVKSYESGDMNVIIPKNTTIPTKKVVQYDMKNANPKEDYKIHMWEGEKQKFQDNNYLGLTSFSGASPSKRRSTSLFHVCFEIDINGILNMSVQDASSGNKSNIVTTDWHRLTVTEMEKRLNEAEYYKDQDKKYKETVKAKNTLENIANGMGERLTETTNVIQGILKWIDLNSEEVLDASEYEQKLKELRQVIDPFISMMG